MLLLILGVVLGFMGSWWGRAWIWLSLIPLIAIMAIMGILGLRIYGEARKAVGLPQNYRRGQVQPLLEPASSEEIDTVLSRGNPMLLTILGFGGIAVIAWLMMFKPF